MKNTIDIAFEASKKRSTVYFGRAAELLPELTAGRRVIMVADETVLRLWGNAFDVRERISVKGEERYKTSETVVELCRALAGAGADRRTFLLAVGGGVTTDVAGFAASVYMRGIPLGLVPTTLLAQADASVGGKNGVNLDGAKNLIGTFSQPEFVVCDTSLLATLPAREMRCGLAEVIKAAVIGDPELFRILREAGPDDFTHESVLEGGGVLRDAVFRAVEVKARIVRRDEREAGERRLLNLGHTFGHAIEKLFPEYRHGEAVAVGIVVACRVGEGLGLLLPEDARAIRELLDKYGFDTRMPAGAGELVGALKYDKKRDGDQVAFVVPTGIGEAETVRLGTDELLGLLDAPETVKTE